MVYAKGILKEDYDREVNYDFEQAVAQAINIYKYNNYDMNIPNSLIKDLDIEQGKFKYIDPNVEDIRYFLEECKPKTEQPQVTCFKELTMAGFVIKSKIFSEIMENCFKEWEGIRLKKTKRIKLSGKSIPVKVYYEKH